MAPKNPELIEHRKSASNQVGVVFVHGFSGDPKQTWGSFPSFLIAEPRLMHWDIYSLGYHTGLSLDVVGLWRADPGIAMLGSLLVTRAALEPLKGYRSVALVAHSMGGLLVQRAILEDPALLARVGFLLLFGTPSAGLKKASLFEFWKPQLKDMGDQSEFITGLRTQWAQKIGDSPTFEFYATAGDEDQFVPPESSIAPFPESRRRVVPGDHLSIVKPTAVGDPSVQIVIDCLAGQAPASGPGESARVAVEMRDFQKAIQLLQDHPESLDEGGLVQLALALDSVGRQKEAIDMLQKRHARTDYTDAMGTLAGRLKRRWLVNRVGDDAEKASALYQQGFDLSEKNQRHDQAFYHGINVAFMQLAYGNQKSAAQETAKIVLGHCAKAEPDKWQSATEGDAHLLLGETDQAIQAYQGAINRNPSPRELDSMLQQAMRMASLLGDQAAGERLQKVFRGQS